MFICQNDNEICLNKNNNNTKADLIRKWYRWYYYYDSNEMNMKNNQFERKSKKKKNENESRKITYLEKVNHQWNLT